MAYPGITNVSSKYGAPMGRGNRIPTEEYKGATYYNVGPACKLHLRRLRFVDGCYDTGGAYWGMPANLYHAVNADRTVEVFVRADSREEAKTAVREILPTVEFFK